jgi:hypothetical protein
MGHTIKTLEHRLIDHKIKLLDQKIKALDARVTLELQARDKALEHQAEQNAEHFTSLNNEAARILAATAVTVSQDTWREFLKNHQSWKDATDKALQGTVSAETFHTYKETTAKATDLRTGNTQGTETSFKRIAALITIAAIAIGAVIALIEVYRS